jgi:hypothetical protein
MEKFDATTAAIIIGTYVAYAMMGVGFLGMVLVTLPKSLHRLGYI